MDTKLIKQYGTEILSYRLRTARQKKRMQYEDFDKQLIQLHKEDRALWKQKQNLGWEPLVPPVQKGWKRFFVLREDVAVGRHAAFFGNILKKINTYDWSHRKDFKVKKRRFGRKKYGVKTQSLLRPFEWQFNKMGFSEAEKQLFHEVWEIDCRKQPVKRYVFNEPWRFVLRVRPNLIDKVKKIDAMLESRQHEIRSYLKRNNYTGRLNKVVCGRSMQRWCKIEKENANILRNRSLQQVLDAIRNDEM
jgi:hypothetical protein